jgi:hypothetical protein
MRSIALSVLVLSMTLVIASARAETPTTQPQITTAAKILGLPVAPTEPGEVEISAPISAFKSSDLDLRFRAPTAPPVNKLKYYGIIGQSGGQRNLQDWSSFNYNGVTIWNRAAIFDRTIHAIKDQTTGKVFYYRDFANTVPIESAAPSTIIRRHSPANDLNLLDDRPKQK